MVVLVDCGLGFGDTITIFLLIFLSLAENVTHCIYFQSAFFVIASLHTISFLMYLFGLHGWFMLFMRAYDTKIVERMDGKDGRYLAHSDWCK